MMENIFVKEMGKHMILTLQGKIIFYEVFFIFSIHDFVFLPLKKHPGKKQFFL